MLCFIFSSHFAVTGYSRSLCFLSLLCFAFHRRAASIFFFFACDLDHTHLVQAFCTCAIRARRQNTKKHIYSIKSISTKKGEKNSLKNIIYICVCFICRDFCCDWSYSRRLFFFFNLFLLAFQVLYYLVVCSSHSQLFIVGFFPFEAHFLSGLDAQRMCVRGWATHF